MRRCEWWVVLVTLSVGALALAQSRPAAVKAANAAQGKPYKLNVVPAHGGRDQSGPEAFAMDKAFTDYWGLGMFEYYRGELTDGRFAKPVPWDRSWVHLPNGFYRDTESRQIPTVLIDLCGSHRVTGVTLSCLGGGARDVWFPQDMRVSVSAARDGKSGFAPCGRLKVAPQPENGKKFLAKRFSVSPINRQARFVKIEIRNLAHGPRGRTVVDELIVHAEPQTANK